MWASWIVLVWLTCGFSTCWAYDLEPTEKIKNDCYKKICVDKACFTSQLSCCGNQTFNPATATCCEVHDGKNKLAKITERLSEDMSGCCGLQAYNKLNQICCGTSILDKPAADAKCCGDQTYDVDRQLCCAYDTILNKTSNHHDCCGVKTFNKKTQCCCDIHDHVEIKNLTCSTCKETCDANVNSLDNQCTPSPLNNICGKETYDVDRQLCCAYDTILNKMSNHHDCCGFKTFNKKTQCCCDINDYVEIKNLTCSTCTETCDANVNSLDNQCTPSPLNNICGKETYDVDRQLCCAYDTILNKMSNHHDCCGDKTFNKKTQCCCDIHDNVEIKNLTCSTCKETCDANVNSLDNQCTPSPLNNICGKETYDVDRQLCCAYDTILNKMSNHHDCCGDKTFNKKTQCCCDIHDNVDIKNLTCSTCKETCDANVNSLDNQCTPSPLNNICGKGVQQQKPRSQLSCTDPHTAICGSTCYNPNLLDCCVRNNTKPNSAASGLRGDAAPTVFNPLTHSCCYGHVIHKNRRTDKFPCSPDKHCCGSEVYNPESHICCNKKRWPKGKHIHCCGGDAYNISDPQMKCCAGTLYNLTDLNQSAHEANCCGSILLQQDDICCFNGDKALLNSAKKGLRCCTGELHLVQRREQRRYKMCQRSRLRPINNLPKARLCEKVKVGTVQSVSRKSVVLIDVLEITGKDGTVKPLPTQVVICNNSCKKLNRNPKLTPNYIYFFDDDTDFFIDFNHHFLHQSLHYILDKCTV